MSQPYPYAIFCGEHKVGLRIFTDQQGPLAQPVVLHADVDHWLAPRDLVDGGPTTLRVGPYEYSGTRATESGDEVVASDDPGLSRVWYLIPGELPNTFIILVNRGTNYGWTAGKPYEPITIQELKAGATNQVFTFVPIYDEA